MATDEMATHAPGNTIQERDTRITKSRDWQLTLNCVDQFEQLKGYLSSLKQLTYAIACHETAPTTGHEHIHVYTQFKNATALSLKKCVGAHIEKCHGTPQQNVAYIRKDGDIIWEFGQLRVHGGSVSIKNLKEMTREEIDELPWNMYNIAQKVKQDEADLIDVDDLAKDVKVYWIQGPSGIGKTERAKEIVRSNQDTYGRLVTRVKYENNFWIGVRDDCPIAIYDDFRDSSMKPSEFINFIDYNVNPMNIKGGHIMNRYKLIIITTVQSLNDIYRNVIGEPREQWMRRIEVIDMFEPNLIDQMMDIDDL